MTPPRLPLYWWSRDPAERYWVEISDRDDFGDDLIHEVEKADGTLMPSYGLARDEINLGDVVFHYDLIWDGIRSWSQVTEPFIEDHEHWEVGLDGPFSLKPALPYKRLGDAADRIARVYVGLPRSREPAQHLPFVISRTGLRVRQTYLAKLPRAMLDLFPQLDIMPND